MANPSEASQELSSAIRELTTVLIRDESLQETLDGIVELARRTVPGCDNASVTMVVQGSPTTTAATDRVVLEVDLLQYKANEGPCLDAYRQRHAVRVDFLVEPERYVHLAPGAVEAGVASVLSSPLEVRGEAIGALNLYSTGDGGFTPKSEEIALLLAGQAAVVIANAQVYENSRNLVSQLEEALESRDVIGQAKGILMAAERVGAEQAFDMLRRASQRQNRKLRDIARDLVDQNARRDT